MSTARPGIALKRLRASNQWTLAEVSKRTGIPASTLSRIENDLISPTYDLLIRLSSGLSIDLSQLLYAADPAPGTGADQPGRRSVSRQNDGDIVQMPFHTLKYLSTDLLNKQMTPIMSEYRARSLAEFGEFMRHSGEEFFLCWRGKSSCIPSVTRRCGSRPGKPSISTAAWGTLTSLMEKDRAARFQYAPCRAMNTSLGLDRCRRRARSPQRGFSRPWRASSARMPRQEKPAARPRSIALVLPHAVSQVWSRPVQARGHQPIELRTLAHGIGHRQLERRGVLGHHAVRLF